MLERGRGLHGRPLQQALPGQEGPVEGARRERGTGTGGSSRWVASEGTNAVRDRDRRPGPFPVASRPFGPGLAATRPLTDR